MNSPVSSWPQIDSGKLRHQIQIQAQSSTQDSFGQPAQTWSTIRTTWGGLNIVSMREVFGSGQLTAQETDVWTVRYSPTEIQPGMQILFGGKVWKVQVISNVEQRNVLLHLLCIEINGTN